MGVYDIFGENNIQIKIGDVEMKKYEIGDEVNLPDGIIIGYEGAIVVKDGIFIAECICLWTKYGTLINHRDIIDGENPVSKIIKEKEKE